MEKPETFEEFKNSFSYGSRNDLLFKFLKNLSTDEASEFFRTLLVELGASFDDGNLHRLIDHVYRWQVSGYQPSDGGSGPWSYQDRPFTPLKKPLSQCRVGLLTSSGHFTEGDDPEPFGIKGMTQQQAIERIADFLKTEPQLSRFSKDTPPERLLVRHGGYDIRGAQADRNVALPVDRLRELEKDGAIGELSSEIYSFVGAAAQTPLLKKVAPQWAEEFRRRKLDALILVPV